MTLEEQLAATATWLELRDRLMATLRPQERELVAFLAEHWGLHAPRQVEVAALEQRLKRAERRLSFYEHWGQTVSEEEDA